MADTNTQTVNVELYDNKDVLIDTVELDPKVVGGVGVIRKNGFHFIYQRFSVDRAIFKMTDILEL